MIELRFKTLKLVLAFVIPTYALSVTQGSPCFDVCEGSTSTAQDDIVCTDRDFTSTDEGTVLSECMTCLHGSDHRNSFLSDSTLFLSKSSSAWKS